MNKMNKAICLRCDKEYEKRHSNMVFCCKECQSEYADITSQVRKMEEIKKIKREYESFGWRRTNIGWLSKYYELFGKNFRCDLCHKTLDKNMKEHGTPLHVILQNGISNHMVMNSDNWTRLCSDCYYEVEYLKRKS